MKTNLSSQIKLDRVPSRYYMPQGEIEAAALTREEKVHTRIFESVADGSSYLARHVAEVIRKNVAATNRCVITLRAGSATHAGYTTLIYLCARGEVSFDKVIAVNRNEFLPLGPN